MRIAQSEDNPPTISCQTVRVRKSRNDQLITDQVSRRVRIQVGDNEEGNRVKGRGLIIFDRGPRSIASDATVAKARSLICFKKVNEILGVIKYREIAFAIRFLLFRIYQYFLIKARFDQVRLMIEGFLSFFFVLHSESYLIGIALREIYPARGFYSIQIEQVAEIYGIICSIILAKMLKRFCVYVYNSF